MSMEFMGKDGGIPVPNGWAIKPDEELSLDSDNSVANKVVTEALQVIEHDIEQLMGLRASLTQAGFVKLTSATDVTDSTGLALPATEKNESISGTLANEISKIREESFINLDGMFEQPILGTDGCYALRYGHTVFLKLTVLFANQLPGGTKWMALPQKYRPKYYVKAPASYNAGGTTIANTITILPDGTVKSDFGAMSNEWMFVYVSYYAD